MVNRNCCSVCGCLNRTSNNTLSFFQLPKNSEWRNEWLKRIGRPDLLNKSDIKHNSYRVCSEHFEDSVMSISKKLLPGAAPTRFLPNQKSQPSLSQFESESHTSDKSVQTKDSYVNELSALKIENASMNDDRRQYARLDSEHATHTTQNLSSGTPRKRELRTELQVTERKKRRLKYELDKIKKGTETRHSLHLTPSCEDDEEITKRFYRLVQWQNSVRNKHKGSRYDSEFKLFALNFYISSPSCYRTLKTLLKLPSESILSGFKLNIRPEIDDSVLNTISKKLQSLPDAAKYCTLCVNQMVLKRHLCYDMRNDEVIGLQDINGKVTKEIAANAYVVMLRGIFVNWKQPIGYALLGSTKYYLELDVWMNEIISKLFTLGIEVMAIVSDQGTHFDKYAKEIKQVTAEKPYFIFKDHKIYYIFDVPHMLKCVRNNLLTNDFIYNENKISWSYIKTLYTHQKEKKLRLLPKITDAHIDPNDFQKVRVKYASQIFSRTVYGALNIFIHVKLLPEEARATAEFVKSMNDLFDVLNSSTINSNSKYQQAFTLSKEQIEVLDTALNMFKKIMGTKRNTGTNNINKIKTFKNFQITIQAIKMLSKALKNEGFTFLFTRRLNQDPLVNFFGTIRQQGGDRSTELTPIQFRRAFSKLFLSNVLKDSPSSNSQGDLYNLLLRDNNILLKEIESPEKTSETPEPSLMISLDCDVDYRFHLPTENVLTYVSGYFLYKCKQKHKCPSFTAYSENNPYLNNVNVFAHFGVFNKKSSFYSALKVPPESFTNYIKELETTFFNNFEQLMLCRPANKLFSLLEQFNLILHVHVFQNSIY